MQDVSNATLDDVVGPVAGAEPTIRPIPLPNGARMAFTIQVALEAWSGATISGPRLPVGPEGRPDLDWATISTQLYGPRTGAARLMRVIDERGMRACIHLSALVAERWPDLVAGIASTGHEVVGHGYRQDERMDGLGEQRDLEVVRRCAEIIEDVTGQRPVGWSSHGSRRGPYTVLNLLKEGYIYTRDFRDSDTPYVAAQLADRRLLAMTRTDEINDMFLVTHHGGAPSVYVEYFKRAFDQLYAEGATEPKVMTCVAHATIFGRPWGASALAECLDYVRQFEGVWQATGREVAEYYLAQLPPLAAGEALPATAG
jgi:peptidoglycan/xylan/chitin deacetylase (PgdA/CDA1 family)